MADYSESPDWLTPVHFYNDVSESNGLCTLIYSRGAQGIIGTVWFRCLQKHQIWPICCHKCTEICLMSVCQFTCIPIRELFSVFIFSLLKLVRRLCYSVQVSPHLLENGKNTRMSKLFGDLEIPMNLVEINPNWETAKKKTKIVKK